MTRHCSYCAANPKTCPKHSEETPPAIVKVGEFANEHAALASGVAFHVANVLNDCFPDAKTISETQAETLGEKILALRLEFRAEDREEVVVAFCNKLLEFPVVAFVKLESLPDDINSELRTVGNVTARCNWALRGMETNPLVILTLVVSGQLK